MPRLHIKDELRYTCTRKDDNPKKMSYQAVGNLKYFY